MGKWIFGFISFVIKIIPKGNDKKWLRGHNKSNAMYTIIFTTVKLTIFYWFSYGLTTDIIFSLTNNNLLPR